MMKNLKSVISPQSNAISMIATITLLVIIFRPSLYELLILLAVDMISFFLMLAFDNRFFFWLYPDTKLYYPAVDPEVVKNLDEKGQDRFLESIFHYPQRRAIWVFIESLVKSIPAVLTATFWWDHGMGDLEAFLKTCGICLIAWSLFYAAVFFENHREVSKLVAELHKRFDWTQAFRRSLHGNQARDLTRQEIVCLAAVWIFMLWTLILVVSYPREGTGALVLEIILVALVGMIEASRIWYLGRKNFIDPLNKIFERFDGFDPRKETVVTSLALDSNPTLARFARVVNDLSDRIKQYERELAHAVFRETEKGRYRALGQLSALIAHDLSAPLHVMQFCADAIAHDPKLASNPRYIAQLTGNSQRAVELVESLKAYLKNPEGREKNALFWASHTNVLRILQVQYEQNAFGRIVFETEGVEHALSVAVPRQDLIHILMNLYKNALDNMIQNRVDPAVLRVRVLLNDRQDEACIFIEDTGSGLARDRYEIMTSQETLSMFNRPQMEGLGLRLVRRLVEQHAGRLEVVDDKSWSGTRFALTLAISSLSARGSGKKENGKGAINKPRPEIEAETSGKESTIVQS